MKKFHVIGGKNQGKTSLIVDLIAEAVPRGLHVASIKHTHHGHELDTVGKDSYRHRQAGAQAVAVLSPDLLALYLPQRPGIPVDKYHLLESWMAPYDLVLVEGDSATQSPKMEVWRSAMGTTPLAIQDSSILAVVTDDPCPVRVPVLPRHDVAHLLTWILTRM